ncbi:MULTISPECIES: biotin--[acetyl-CoA-carboxylase] ligase [unclassified Bosea (in: a-proteobacteria)]|uniref:biotin--[acetyl-CoA-carboxylase] ligase n=1 Tax=unclassified Bosea (in: a-proteobacteria) TaxID=2653178 RepID=UPI0009613004|nr:MULTISPECIES: biotin--[acetyl-CoA-carboxylase] ligase [unclassified Bosea (in: a-proteobacteria)]OJV09849.1 MAG: biotin--[acetyl-CoA-carboxylase] ligase [Bosea sp. 67-29]
MLGEAARAASYRLVVRDEVASTMDEARRALEQGEPGKLWIVARSQHAGRGRHGRQWGSPPGNLYASLLLTDPCEPALAPQLGFVAGLALHDAAAGLLGPAASGLRLKWPNDLLLGGAKTSGLLLEGESRGGRLNVILGCGVNIASCPSDTPYPATYLKAVAPEASVEALLGALSDAWARRFAVWSQPGGFGPTRAAWLERAAFLGETITIRLPEGPLAGIFIGLDPIGRLELETEAGRRLIDAGDLFFGRPA